MKTGFGLKEMSLVQGVEVSAMSQMAEWVVQSEKVLTF